MAVRCARIEIAGFGKTSGRRDNWKQLAIDCQRIKNRLWQIWICHHVNNGSASKLRDHFTAYERWQETKAGNKPEWPCNAIGHELQDTKDDRSFYRIINAEFPGIHIRTRGLIINSWQSLLLKRKSSSGSLPGWVAILFALESVPSFTKPQPIPFDKQNARLAKDGDVYVLNIRIDRSEDTGKAVAERCELILGKRKCRSVRATVDKILRGEYAWKGSDIVFDKGKWFASISYEIPKSDRKALDDEKVMFVRPGCYHPWIVRVGGKQWHMGGNGANVEHARRSLQRERASRKEHYRWAGSNQKGHGRHRADHVWTKLSSRWKDFAKRYNHELSRRIVQAAIKSGCGRIVYLQPKEKQRDSRQLSKAGNDGRHAMYWDYFQFGSMLASKCESEGIEYGAKPKAKASTGRVRGVRKASESKLGKRPKQESSNLSRV